ncbi:MAG: hypothetical protein Q8R04_07570 [Nanoarchaeota archaeon]|nr:hypothetical protein [Nanoarchaeota archaeon]
MDIEELKKRIKEFDKKTGWDKTDFGQLVDFLQDELDNLKSSEGDKNRVNHLLTDLLVLIMQTSYRYDTNFDSELERWFRESEKYLK